MRVEVGQEERVDEEDAAEPAGDLREHVRRLRSEKVLRHPAAKSRAQAFVFRALHEDDQDDQQRHEHVQREKNIEQDRQHGARNMDKSLWAVKWKFPPIPATTSSIARSQRTRGGGGRVS